MARFLFFFFIFHALSFELNFFFDRRFPLILHLLNSYSHGETKFYLCPLRGTMSFQMMKKTK